MLKPMVECSIFDLDGTLADVRHRLHHIKGVPDGTKPNWKKFFDACCDDLPNKYVIRLNHMCYAAMPAVFICSGRPDSHLQDTQYWLKRFDVRYHRLFMHQHGDYRADTIVKKEMLDQIRDELGFKPTFAVDDRPDVVAMWRQNGVPCFVVDDTEWHT